MTEPVEEVTERSYGCTYGCGNPYDFVIVDVASSTTEFLCLPCFAHLAAQVIEVVNDPDGEMAKLAASMGPNPEQAPMTGTRVRKGRRNAPAGTDDPDVVSAFDGTIAEDELPEEFR